MIIGTITVSTSNSCNLGLRIVDENGTPLPPNREKKNDRHSAHFTVELSTTSRKNATSITFHLIANCQYAKLQVCPGDSLGQQYTGVVFVNHTNTGSDVPDAAWNHKTISTMSVIPLVPSYQGGDNTIFTYPQLRVGRPEKKTGIKTPTSSLR
ncbi:MAG: hypothetical protein AAF706_03240 [Bacteroidota bacterium]